MRGHCDVRDSKLGSRIGFTDMLVHLAMCWDELERGLYGETGLFPFLALSARSQKLYLFIHPVSVSEEGLICTTPTENRLL